MLHLSATSDVDDDEQGESESFWSATTVMLVAAAGVVFGPLTGFLLKQLQVRRWIGSDASLFPAGLLTAAVCAMILVAASPIGRWLYAWMERRQRARRRRVWVVAGCVGWVVTIGLAVGFKWVYEWNKIDLAMSLGREIDGHLTGSTADQIALVLAGTPSVRALAADAPLASPFDAMTAQYDVLVEKNRQNELLIEELQRQVGELSRPGRSPAAQQPPSSAGRGSPIGEAPAREVPPPPSAPDSVGIEVVRSPSAQYEPTISVTLQQAKEALSQIDKLLSDGGNLRRALERNPKSSGQASEFNIWDGSAKSFLRERIGAPAAGEFVDVGEGAADTIGLLDKRLSYLKLLRDRILLLP